MQISGRFTIAVHILTCTDYFHDDYTITSKFLASSIGVNPVIVRQVILFLKRAGLIDVVRGKEGIILARPLEEITLYDVYIAVESVKGGKLFRFHENPNPDCPVGKNIHSALDWALDEVQSSLEEKMRGITLREISQRLPPQN
ncbi:MAG: Rrf2 family transcriptional regulator [Synergistaceae bacterium]|nr:Rrf2 family transcriptional regulator [Synergistaceae bacterium]